MRPAKSILVVEHEAGLAESLLRHLGQEGYVCRRVSDGRAALTEAWQHRPDLILLDRVLPGMSGDDLIMRLRSEPRTAAIPTVLLISGAGESEALVGFASGADDCVTKPFSMKVLLARIAAILRRTKSPGPEDKTLSAGSIQLNLQRYEVSVHNQRVPVTTTEFGILRSLILANGRVLSRDQLFEAVRGLGAAPRSRTVDVHIAALRKKLGDAGRWIQAIRGVGYTFREPEREHAERAD